MGNPLKDGIRAAVFAALVTVGAYIRIPVGPVPIVLANFFVILAGLLLGWRWGVTSVAIYLLLGTAGLPVFTSGGGVAALIGPTGGYLMGYLPAAALAGAISGDGRPRLVRDIAAVAAAVLVLYAAGIPWLKLSTGMEWNAALAAGMIPFLPGDAVKAAAAVAVLRAVERSAPELFPHITRRVSPGTRPS